MTSVCRSLIVVTAIFTAASSPASGQTSLTVDAGLYNAYIWRGVTLSNKPVLEPDAYLTIPVGGGGIVLGGWGNIELGQYDAPDISEGGGVTSLDVTEIDVWAEYARTFGNVTVTVGGIEYLYPNDFGFTSDVNTLELYGKIGLGVALSPRLSAYYDVDEVKGLYLEGTIGHSLQVTPSFAISLGALAGFSAGQEPTMVPSMETSSMTVSPTRIFQRPPHSIWGRLL